MRQHFIKSLQAVSQLEGPLLDFKALTVYTMFVVLASQMH